MLRCVETEGVRPGYIYDVGASTGSMLWHFREHGWTVGGCDLSAKAVEQAKALNDITVDPGSDEDTLADRRSIDLITFSHVLEHIYDPPTTLRRVHDALTDDGLLMFEVPCLAAPEINPPGLFMMEHINYFDESSIENLLGRTGFQTLQATVTLDHFPFPVITVLARARGNGDRTPRSSAATRRICPSATRTRLRSSDAGSPSTRACGRRSAPAKRSTSGVPGCTRRRCSPTPASANTRPSWRSPTGTRRSTATRSGSTRSSRRRRC
jgi:hypothetical protein